MPISKQEILVEKRQDHIAIVTINRPHVRNAINASAAQALDATVKDIEQDDDIWTVVLTSVGGVAFSAGADLKDVSQGKVNDLILEDSGFAGFVHAKRTKPWIAVIDGFAVAGGCEIALACDLIVATKTSVFGLPEVARGLIAAGGGAYRLPRAIPKAIAIECLLTANPLSAERAAEFGMINRVVEKGEALNSALELAQEVTANAPVAVRESLAIARQASDLNDQELRQLCDNAQTRIVKTEDFAEGPLAFVEKRAPVWTGR